jgi:hypothetical protein
MIKAYIAQHETRRAVINGKMLMIMGDDGIKREAWRVKYKFRSRDFDKLKLWADNWAMNCKLPKLA